METLLRIVFYVVLLGMDLVPVGRILLATIIAHCAPLLLVAHITAHTTNKQMVSVFTTPI